MERYAIYKETIEVKRAKDVQEGLTFADMDHYPDYVKAFETKAEADKFLKTCETRIDKTGDLYMVTEYFEQKEEYNDLYDEWDPVGDMEVGPFPWVCDEDGRFVRFDAAVALMDDEIREAVHADLAPCTNQEFFAEYARRHAEKYGDEFEVI